MRPRKDTIFHELSEINNYCDKDKYYCTAVVFSPETENDHFNGCPPYIQINEIEDHIEINTRYFAVPEIVAYYAKTHPCYTMRGIEIHRQQGEYAMKDKIKKLLDIT